MMLAPYGWLTLVGVLVSLVLWRRIARRDPRLLTIYLAALLGAFIGAKIIYFLAEGYLHVHDADRWRQWATGKSILGGLLGGYAGVEGAKAFLRYPGTTGDWFALLVPIGILLGRIGCLTSGCCQGVVCHPAWFTLKDRAGQARWPSVPVEIAFNLLALGVVLALRHSPRLKGQHFHIYLIAYGVFRFFHEFLRDEPRLLVGFSGYQFAALAVLALGVERFVHRREQNPRHQMVADNASPT